MRARGRAVLSAICTLNIELLFHALDVYVGRFPRPQKPSGIPRYPLIRSLSTPARTQTHVPPHVLGVV